MSAEKEVEIGEVKEDQKGKQRQRSIKRR